MAKKKNAKAPRKPQRKSLHGLEIDGYNREFGWNETFGFIAGFTPGGAAFGTTWEEMEDPGPEDVVALPENPDQSNATPTMNPTQGLPW